MDYKKSLAVNRQIDALEKNFGKLRVDRMKFWRIARRAEKWLHREIEYYLNMTDSAKELSEFEHYEYHAKKCVDIARCFENPKKIFDVLFVNEDPRGYALKLHFGGVRKSGIFTDLGGDGVLAPEF